MSENQTIGSDIFRYIKSGILNMAAEAYDAFIEENELQQQRSEQKDVVYEVADEQTENAYNDFLQTEKQDPEDINNQIKEYISENYDDEFFMVKISEKVDFDELREDLIDDLLLYLTTTEPYNSLPREYWNNQARRVPYIKELAEYTREGGADYFVEKYAPEWKVIVEQNQSQYRTKGE